MVILWHTTEGTGPDTTGAGDIDMFCKISQTYDLSTKLGKMSIVGIHTPSTLLVSNMYSGFMHNFKRWRPVSCDVSMACASLLPADPLQVGVEAGEIAPQDMFNPILYKAVTNDSFDMIFSRLLNFVTGSAVYPGLNPSINNTNTVNEIQTPFNTWTTEQYENAYYGLLSMDGWRKAMPQAGLHMGELVPLVHEVLSSYGNVNAPASTVGSNTNVLGNSGGGATLTSSNVGNVIFRGRPVPLPSVPTHIILSNTGADTDASLFTPAINTFVAMLVLPPGKLNVLYYRLKVTWLIEFIDPCADNEVMMPGLLATSSNAAVVYGTDYPESAKSSDQLSEKGDMVDSENSELKLVMTASR